MSKHNITLDYEAAGYPDWHMVANRIEKDHVFCERSGCCFRMLADQIRAQIKSPQRAEPAGLGAVVEGSAYTDDVRRFVRCQTDGSPWVDENCEWHTWEEIDVVRVLSEGMTS